MKLACESCGEPATIASEDGSVWCVDCNDRAILLGYDLDFGVGPDGGWLPREVA